MSKKWSEHCPASPQEVNSRVRQDAEFRAQMISAESTVTTPVIGNHRTRWLKASDRGGAIYARVGAPDRREARKEPTDKIFPTAGQFSGCSEGRNLTITRELGEHSTLFLAYKQPFKGLIEFSAYCKQNLRSDFIASMLDCRQIALAHTNPTGKICLRHVKSSQAPNSSTDGDPVDRRSFCLQVFA